LFLFAAFCQLSVVHAFPDPFEMPDLPSYCETFVDFAKENLWFSIFTGYTGVKMEPGWIVFCKILGLVSMDYRILLITTSLIIVGGYCITIKRYSPIYWLSVFIFLCTTYNQSLFVLRQHCSIALCLLSIKYILSRNYKKYILLNAIAFSFHQTALFFFPMYWLFKTEINAAFWGFFLVFFILGRFVAAFVFPLIFNNIWYASYADMGGSNLTMFFIQLCTLFLYLVSANWNLKKLGDVNKCFFIMCCVAILLAFIGYGYSPTNRLIKYYTVSSIWLIPKAIINFRSFGVRIVVVFAVVVAYFALFFSAGNIEYLGGFTLKF
jgi:hypothetical protein